MAKKFTSVTKTIGAMSTDEIRAWLAGQPDSQVMRSILFAELQAVRNGENRERRTMRGMWYDVVKPVLSRAGLLNSKTKTGENITWDAKLSKYLAELVRSGETTYEELLIVDGSRQRQPAREITTGLVDVALVGAHFPWVILFTEKDTIWGELQNLADLYGISAISGGGEPSLACTENTIREIVTCNTFQAAQPEAIVILLLTDYDPFGYKIAEAQIEQIKDVASAIDPESRRALRRVVPVRLGLVPDQLTPDELQAKAYEPKDTGLESWLKKTGGVNGQPLGLELDALPLSRLRRMFAQGIEQHIELEKRKNDLREAFLDLMACDLLMPEFERKREAMRAAVRKNGAWQALTNAPIPDDIFRQAAIDGESWITPSQTVRLFAGQQEQVKRIMGEIAQA